MSDQVQGYFGATLIVRGRVEGRGDLVVVGRVEGELSIDGALVVAEGGSCIGDVSARVVDVLGLVQGDVVGMESVAIRAGGSVEGNVRGSSVAIDDGGALHGGIDMDFSIDGQGV